MIPHRFILVQDEPGDDVACFQVRVVDREVSARGSVLFVFCEEGLGEFVHNELLFFPEIPYEEEWDYPIDSFVMESVLDLSEKQAEVFKNSGWFVARHDSISTVVNDSEFYLMDPVRRFIRRCTGKDECLIAFRFVPMNPDWFTDFESLTNIQFPA